MNEGLRAEQTLICSVAALLSKRIDPVGAAELESLDRDRNRHQVEAVRWTEGGPSWLKLDPYQ